MTPEQTKAAEAMKATGCECRPQCPVIDHFEAADEKGYHNVCHRTYAPHELTPMTCPACRAMWQLLKIEEDAQRIEDAVKRIEAWLGKEREATRG